MAIEHEDFRDNDPGKKDEHMRSTIAALERVCIKGKQPHITLELKSLRILKQKRVPSVVAEWMAENEKLPDATRLRITAEGVEQLKD